MRDAPCCFLASLGFPFALRATWLFGRSNNRRGTAPWARGRPGGTRLGAAISSCSSKGEIFYSNPDLLLANVRCFSDYSMYTPSVLAMSTLIRMLALRRFVWYTACHATMRQSVARTICSYGSSHRSRVNSLLFRPFCCQSRQQWLLQNRSLLEQDFEETAVVLESVLEARFVPWLQPAPPEEADRR
jgi:hypothetical protein